MKAADIHAALAQDRADAADDAGHVVTARHEHVAVRCRFEMKAVDLRYTAFAPLSAIAKECSGQALRRLARFDLSMEGRRHVARGANVSSRNFDTTFFSDQERVDDVHARTHVA